MQNVFETTILHIVFSVTYYFELYSANEYLLYIFFFCQQRSNWLFEHYITLTYLLGIKIYIKIKSYNIV